MTHIQRLILWAIFAMTFAASPLWASNPQSWSLSHIAHSEHDPDVYVRPVKGLAIKAIKGTIQVPYAVDQVVSALKDRSRMPEWVYQCRRVQQGIVKNKPNIYYTEINGIWPIKSRDVVIKSTFTADKKSGGIRGVDESMNGVLAQKKGFIRLPMLRNNWHIYPSIKRGWSVVEFESMADVGGGVPKWLANMAALDAPRKTLSGLRELLDTGDYGQATAKGAPKPTNDEDDDF